MKVYWYYISLILIIFFKSTDLLNAQSITQIQAIKNPLQQIEAVLNLPSHFNRDTTLLKKELEPIKTLAKQHNSIPLELSLIHI